MLGRWTSPVNGQDQIIQSGYYCYLSIRVASINEKNIHRKIAWTLTQTARPNRIALHVSKQGMHSAEVGALTLEFAKSAAELKPNLFVCKSIVNITIFNVRPLHTINQQAHTDWNPHVDICIYHFIALTISDQPRNCFRLFIQVRPVSRIFDWRLIQGSICINSSKAWLDYLSINKKWIKIALKYEAYINLLKEYLPITESSRQRFAWVYTEIRNKQLKFYNMISYHLKILMLAINIR